MMNENRKIAHFPFMLGVCVICGNMMLRKETDGNPICDKCTPHGELV